VLVAPSLPRPVRRLLSGLWTGPAALPTALRLEWRLFVGRWVGIGVFSIALALGSLPRQQALAAYTVLALASAHNLLLLHLIRRGARTVRDGWLPLLADGLLCAAMLWVVGGADTPFYPILYAVVVAAGMRHGLARGTLLGAAIATCDALSRLAQGGALDSLFVIRSGVLFMVVVLTSFLYEEAQKSEAALADRLRQAEMLNQALEHQAQHDLLTDLPNRSLLHHRLQQVMLCNRHLADRSAALLVIDLDRFKEVNDTFGHQHGDVLLQQIGDRLLGLFGADDVIARLGGDEFAVLLPEADTGRAQRAAGRILAALDEPFSIGDYPVDVGGSIGIALAPEHGSDADVLLRRADVAMYVAKRAARGIAVYSPELDPHTPERLALGGELRRALEAGSDELHLVYQPKLSLRSGRCVGVEALIRWRHPQRGLVQPDQFIPLAEQTGLIKPLSQWVLNTALEQAQRWSAVGLDIPIAVNLAMRDLHDPELPETVAALLQRWQVPPSRLMVEITENGLMAEPARALQTVTGLRTMGIRIAIDDFGTGYSSLAYLKRLPVDELKIDRSFVRELADDSDDLAIVRSTISLGHDLGLSVVAEGIEDALTWDLLQEHGCDVGQGYHLGRPMTANEIAARFAPHEDEVFAGTSASRPASL